MGQHRFPISYHPPPSLHVCYTKFYPGTVSAVTATHISVRYDDEKDEPPVRYEKAQMDHGTTWRFYASQGRSGGAGQDRGVNDVEPGRAQRATPSSSSSSVLHPRLQQNLARAAAAEAPPCAEIWQNTRCRACNGARHLPHTCADEGGKGFVGGNTGPSMIDGNGDNDDNRFQKKLKATRSPAPPPSPPLTSSASSSTAPTKALVHNDHDVAQQDSGQAMHATFSPIDFAEGGWHDDGIPEKGAADATSQERDRTVSPVSAFGFPAEGEVDQELDNIVAAAANMTERQQIAYLMALSGDGGNVGDGKVEEAAAQKVQAGGG